MKHDKLILTFGHFKALCVPEMEGKYTLLYNHPDVAVHVAVLHKKDLENLLCGSELISNNYAGWTRTVLGRAHLISIWVGCTIN